MDTITNETLHETTASWNGHKQGHGVHHSCPEKLFDGMAYASGIISGVSIVLMIATLLIIACHPRLCKKKNIFPFNIVLADCVLGGYIFVDYLTWAIGSSYHSCLSCLAALPFVASQMVSSSSVFLVALDQLIVFRVDPFGVKNILTRYRRISISLLTWVTMIVVAACVTTVFPDPMAPNARFYFCNFAVAFTGIFYFLVYRTVASAPIPDVHGQQKRRRDNVRVLRTYALVFGSTIVLSSLPDFYCFVAYYINMAYVPDCVTLGWVVMIALNTLANTLIYWWRLREFRAIFPSSLAGRRRRIKKKHSIIREVITTAIVSSIDK